MDNGIWYKYENIIFLQWNTVVVSIVVSYANDGILRWRVFNLERTSQFGASDWKMAKVAELIPRYSRKSGMKSASLTVS